MIVFLISAPLFAFEFDIDDVGDLIESLSKLKIEGKGYFYYMHDMSEDDGQTNRFDFSRMYFGAKYRLSDNFSVRYLSDFSHEDKTGKFEVFAKYAYVDWNINDKLTAIMGLQGTSNWKQPENAWGYRSIQYAPMEAFGKYWGLASSKYMEYILDPRRTAGVDSEERLQLMRRYENLRLAGRSKMGSSADMGLILKFKPMTNSYAKLMVLNGTGYKKAENDMYKNFQLRMGTKMINNRLHLSGYVEVEPWDGPDLGGQRQLYMNMQWDLLASFKRNGIFTAGVNLNGKKFDGIEIINSMNYSVFGNFHILQEELKILARYDYYSTGFDDGEVLLPEDQWETNGSLIIVGLDYIAHKNIHIIPNFQMLSYEDSERESNRTAYVHLSFKF